MKWSVYTHKFPQPLADSGIEYLLNHVDAWQRAASGFPTFSAAHTFAQRAMTDGHTLAGLEPYTGNGRLLLSEIHFSPHVVILRLPGLWPPSPMEQQLSEEEALGLMRLF
jgi:hypothetical protein